MDVKAYRSLAKLAGDPEKQEQLLAEAARSIRASSSIQDRIEQFALLAGHTWRWWKPERPRSQSKAYPDASLVAGSVDEWDQVFSFAISKAPKSRRDVAMELAAAAPPDAMELHEKTILKWATMAQDTPRNAGLACLRAWGHRDPEAGKRIWKALLGRRSAPRLRVALLLKWDPPYCHDLGRLEDAVLAWVDASQAQQEKAAEQVAIWLPSSCKESFQAGHPSMERFVELVATIYRTAPQLCHLPPSSRWAHRGDILRRVLGSLALAGADEPLLRPLLGIVLEASKRTAIDATALRALFHMGAYQRAVEYMESFDEVPPHIMLDAFWRVLDEGDHARARKWAGTPVQKWCLALAADPSYAVEAPQIMGAATDKKEVEMVLRMTLAHAPKAAWEAACRRYIIPPERAPAAAFRENMWIVLRLAATVGDLHPDLVETARIDGLYTPPTFLELLQAGQDAVVACETEPSLVPACTPVIASARKEAACRRAPHCWSPSWERRAAALLE